MCTSPKLLQGINNGFMASLDNEKFILFQSRLLYKFLKQKRCLKQFVENRVRLRGYNCPNGGEELLKFLSNTTISCAFCWAETTEGHNFWSKLDKEYYKFIEKNQKII